MTNTKTTLFKFAKICYRVGVVARQWWGRVWRFQDGWDSFPSDRNSTVYLPAGWYV